MLMCDEEWSDTSSESEDRDDDDDDNDKDEKKEHLFTFHIVAVVNMSFVKWSIHQDESRPPII